MDLYQQYIHKSRYARYLPDEQRRETWEETIDRYLNFWIEKGKITLEEANGMFADFEAPAPIINLTFSALRIWPTTLAIFILSKILNRKQRP